jgi:8-oxo-dGTP diphosphatase
MKPRAAVILIENGKIAMIERHKAGVHYIVFPGGKIEPGESPADTARREIEEELGLDVIIGKMVAEVWYLQTPQYYFLATRSGGTFGSGTGKEMAGLPESPKGSHRPTWIALDELLTMPVLPNLMAELVANSYPDQWPDQPWVIDDDPPKERR